MSLDERAQRAIKLAVEGSPPIPPEVMEELRRLLPLAPAAREVEPAPELDPPRQAQPQTALYRHFDSDGALLYVGISSSLHARTKQHATSAVWQEYAAKSEAEWFPTRYEAELAERKAIREERPLFNVVHAAGASKEDRVRYLVARGRSDLLELKR